MQYVVKEIVGEVAELQTALDTIAVLANTKVVNDIVARTARQFCRGLCNDFTVTATATACG